MTIKDDRTTAQVKSTIGYVNATDSFLSGKLCDGPSYYCLACDDYDQVEAALKWLKSRDEMKRVSGSNRPRLGRGGTYHCKISHVTRTAAWT